MASIFLKKKKRLESLQPLLILNLYDNWGRDWGPEAE